MKQTLEAGVAAEPAQVFSPADQFAQLGWENWEFRIEPPHEKVRTVRARFTRVADYPFETRPDPRD